MSNVSMGLATPPTVRWLKNDAIIPHAPAASPPLSSSAWAYVGNISKDSVINSAFF